MNRIFDGRKAWLAAMVSLLAAAPLGMDCGLITSASMPRSAVEPAARAGVLSSYGKLPIRFEPNVGQASPSVQYLARGGGYSVGLTEQGALLSLARAAGKPATAAAQVKAPPAPAEQTLLRLSLVQAKAHPRLAAEGRQDSVSNYFIGNDPSKWHSNVANYGAVRYQQVYPGIDWVVYGNPQQLEYDLVVAPQADPGRVKLDIEGADSLALDGNGDLLVRVKDRSLRQLKPVVYQTTAQGERRNIEGRYVLDHGQVAFALGDYDHDRSLTIDPVLAYAYSTYLGGGAEDQAAAITVDSAGNAYVVGNTDSTDFPTVNPGKSSLGGSQQAFVSKLNPAGSALLYSTYLGGSAPGGNNANGVAVDSAGNAYVVGFTGSTSFPVTANAPQPTNPGGTGEQEEGTVGAAFVTKLGPAGNTLVYSTYLGGSGGEFIGDQANAVAVDGNGEAYVAGVTESDNFPATNGSYQQVNDNEGGTNAFVAKYNRAGGALVYATYLGGNGEAEASAIALDGSGSAYVAGSTLSTNFPTTEGAFSGPPQFASLYFYAFVTKFNPAGSALVYSTYLGGTGGNNAYGIAVNSAGNAYVTGGTQSANFPTAPAHPYQGQTGGGQDGDADAFVTEFNPAGSALVYSTYLGGSRDEQANAIALDSAGNAYVAGTTDSSDFPVTANALENALETDGGSTAFVTVFDAAGTALNYSSYLGGSNTDTAYAIAVDSAGGIYVAGETESDDFPTTAHPAQGTYGGSGDAFVTKISTATTPAPTVSLQISSTSITLGQSVTLTWTSTNATSCTASGAWSGTEATSNTEGQSETPDETGTDEFILTCTGPGGTSSPSSQTLTVTAATPPAPTVSLQISSNSIILGNSVTLTWTSTNATACTASGAWSGSEPPNSGEEEDVSRGVRAADASAGVTETPATVGTFTYTLTCTGPGGTSAPSSQTLTVSTVSVNNTVTASAGGFGPGVLSVLGLFAALRRRRKLPLLALLGTGLLTLAVLPAPAQAEQLSFDTQHAYVGMKVGEGVYGLGSAEFSSQLAAQGDNVSDVSLDKHRVAGGIYGGVPFWSGLAVEAGFVDLGKYEVSLNGSGSNLTSDVAHTLRPAGQGITLGLGGALPAFGSFYLEPHVALLIYDSTQQANAGAATLKAHKAGVGGAFGVSGFFKITSHINAGLGFDAYVQDGGNSINLPSAQLEYRFGD